MMKTVWEHAIRDDTDYARHIDQAHWKPMKYGLVPRVADWPYSSFHHDVRPEFCPRTGPYALNRQTKVFDRSL